MRDDVVRYSDADALVDEYILAHIDAEPEALREVQRLTHLRLTYPQMCSGHLQGRLLKMLCALTGARRVLELGTFSGYSALAMAEALAETYGSSTEAPGTTPEQQCRTAAGRGARVDTIEVFDEMEDFLHHVFSTTHLGELIHLHIGDACDILPTLGDAPYDVCLIDADKRRYVDYYRLVLPLMRPGGLILADNTLWDGKVVRPVKESDTQTRGVMAFNDLVASDPRVEKVLLPLRDGLTLIRKKAAPSALA